MQAKAFMRWKESVIVDWLEQLKHAKEPPTEEQMFFLKAVVDRCREEMNSFKKSPSAKEFQDALKSTPQSNKKIACDSKAIKGEYSLAF